MKKSVFLSQEVIKAKEKQIQEQHIKELKKLQSEIKQLLKSLK